MNTAPQPRVYPMRSGWSGCARPEPGFVTWGPSHHVPKVRSMAVGFLMKTLCNSLRSRNR